MTKFIIDNVVITQNNLPAYILSDAPGGELYSVNEMFRNSPQIYANDDLRLATEEECQLLGVCQPEEAAD